MRLQSVANRVDSLRLVHERLFVSGQVEQIDLAAYLRELCLARFRMHGIDPEGSIRLSLNLAPVETNSDQAVSLGLITNEFVTNSLKYAFPMGRGVVRVVLEPLDGNILRLLLADDGIGIPEDRNERPSGMGMRLIGMMAEQIGAEVEWTNDGGAGLTLTLLNCPRC